MVRHPFASRALLLGVTLALPVLALAQPESKPQIQKPPTQLPTRNEINVVVPAEGQIGLSLEVSNAPVADVLRQIATRGGLQIVIAPDIKGTIKTASFTAPTAVGALYRICAAVRLSCEQKDDVWVITASKADADKPAAERKVDIDSMEFREVEIKTLLNLLATQFNQNIAVAKDVDGQIPFIRLSGKSFRQAVDLIALAANLKVEQSKDGVLILSNN